MNEKIIRVSNYEKKTNLLGPNERFAIWVFGCCFNCEGCLTKTYKNGSFTTMKVDELAKLVIESGCEGITISGGEPFLQVESIICLIQEIKKHRDVGVIIYSGFTIEELDNRENAKELLSLTDILIDGRYEKDLDDGRAYVGSSNQRIHYLTGRYKTIGEDYYSAKGRKSQISILKDEVVLIGVPSKETLKIWKQIREKSGGYVDEFVD